MLRSTQNWKVSLSSFPEEATCFSLEEDSSRNNDESPSSFVHNLQSEVKNVRLSRAEGKNSFNAITKDDI